MQNISIQSSQLLSNSTDRTSLISQSPFRLDHTQQLHQKKRPRLKSLNLRLNPPHSRQLRLLQRQLRQ